MLADFDRYCDEHNIAADETPAAFAAWLNQQTGWDGDMAQQRYIDMLIDRVETHLTDELHADQCGCRTWPDQCASGMTRDRLRCASFGPEATIRALAKLASAVRNKDI